MRDPKPDNSANWETIGQEQDNRDLELGGGDEDGSARSAKKAASSKKASSSSKKSSPKGGRSTKKGEDWQMIEADPDADQDDAD